MDWKILFVLLLPTVVIAIGGAAKGHDIANDCDAFGRFVQDDVVYVCHRKPAAEGTVK